MLNTFHGAWCAANVPYKVVISNALIKQNYSAASLSVTIKTSSQSIKSIKAKKKIIKMIHTGIKYFILTETAKC